MLELLINLPWWAWVLAAYTASFGVLLAAAFRAVLEPENIPHGE
jgi:hypothetical protein